MFRTDSIDSGPMAKAKPETVSSTPLFEWFDADKKNRMKLRIAGYSHGRLTNWKTRGIPRAEVGEIAELMGLSYEQYMAAAGAVPEQQRKVPSDQLSPEAIEIARAFDRMEPQTQSQIRQHVFIYSIIDRSFPWLRLGRPVSASYGQFEKWHADNLEANITVKAQSLPPKDGKK